MRSKNWFMREPRRSCSKTSASPTGLPEVLVDPINQPWAQANLGKVFQLLAQTGQQYCPHIAAAAFEAMGSHAHGQRIGQVG